MTIRNMIPKELEKYVWFEDANTLTHSDDMPAELAELFEQTKLKIKNMGNDQKNELEKLLK